METDTARGVILFNPALLEYDALVHPEGEGRLAQIVRELSCAGLWGEQVIEADIAPLKRLREIHDPEYLNELHKRCTHEAERLDDHTPLFPKSLEVARFGAGGVLDAADLIMQEQAVTAFCLTAMPTHGAGYATHGMGGIINAMATGAHYLTKKYRLQRVLILDLDANHAKGTQEIFYRRRDVLTISLHEYPGKTGTGHYSETGDKSAPGFNINVPFPSGYGDREYRVCFKEILNSIIKQFHPQFILLTFGTNILADDPGAHLLVSPRGLLEIVADVLALAHTHCQGKCISIFEGGAPSLLTAQIVAQQAMLMVNNRMPSADRGKKDEQVSYCDWFRYAKLLKGQFRKYWKL